jgi:prephenate dehydrogenase
VTDAPIQRLCVIGVGLIGGSLARALRAAGACGEIVGCGRDAQQLQKALALGVIDRAETDIARAVQGADVVVVAVPVGAMSQVFQAMAQHLSPNTIVTDVGSTKGDVVRAAQNVFGAVPPTFVPGHPIAGTEQSGVEASFAELFRNRKVILTPAPTTHAWAVARVTWMWQQVGAQVTEMDPQHHDEILAASSHLPHVLAYTLVHTLAGMRDSDEIFKYAAGGFRDFTRIASSDPQMWHDICLANRDALLTMLRRYSGELQQIAEALQHGDGAYLQAVFAQAKQARDVYTQTIEASADAQTSRSDNQQF